MFAGNSSVPRVFISHSSKDNAFCYKLVQDLRGFLGDEDAVWFDTMGGLAGGDSWWRKIVEEITNRDIFIVIVSPEAMASPWVNDEITLAWVQKNSKPERHIIPIFYVPCEMRNDIVTLHSVSFLPPRAYSVAFKELLKCILMQPASKKLPRRAMVGGLAAGLTLLAGGLAFALTQLNQHIQHAKGITSNYNSVFMIPGTPAQSYEPWLPWSPDSKYLAAQNYLIGGTLDVWNIQQKKLISSFYGHQESTNAVLDIVWSPDGRALASIDTVGTMQVSDPFVGRLVRTYQCFSTTIRNAHIFWSHDRLSVVALTGKDNNIHIWDAGLQEYILSTGSYIKALDAVYWSPHATHLALKDLENPIGRVWDATLKNKVLVYLNSYQASLIVWSPNLQYLASSINGQNEADNIVQVWNASTANPLLTYRGHTGLVSVIAWSPDGKSIVSGGTDETAQVWNAHTGIPIFIYRGHVNERLGGIDAIAWSPDGRYIASTGYNGPIHVWQSGNA